MSYGTVADALCLMRREDGSHLISIHDYYLTRVSPMDSKFRVGVPDVGNKKGVCPLHDDIGPSFGVLNGNDGRERFNCFGCQQFGHIVDLHKAIVARYESRKITAKESAYELISLFRLDKEILENAVRKVSDKLETSNEKAEQRRKRQADELVWNKFTDRDFRKAVIEGQITGKGEAYFNTLLHRITDEAVKELNHGRTK